MLTENDKQVIITALRVYISHLEHTSLLPNVNSKGLLAQAQEAQATLEKVKQS